MNLDKIKSPELRECILRVIQSRPKDGVKKIKQIAGITRVQKEDLTSDFSDDEIKILNYAAPMLLIEDINDQIDLL